MRQRLFLSIPIQFHSTDQGPQSTRILWNMEWYSKPMYTECVERRFTFTVHFTMNVYMPSLSSFNPIQFEPIRVY